jgi:hypothetical protein
VAKAGRRGLGVLETVEVVTPRKRRDAVFLYAKGNGLGFSLLAIGPPSSWAVTPVKVSFQPMSCPCDPHYCTRCGGSGERSNTRFPPSPSGYLAVVETRKGPEWKRRGLFASRRCRKTQNATGSWSTCSGCRLSVR